MSSPVDIDHSSIYYKKDKFQILKSSKESIMPQNVNQISSSTPMGFNVVNCLLQSLENPNLQYGVCQVQMDSKDYNQDEIQAAV